MLFTRRVGAQHFVEGAKALQILQGCRHAGLRWVALQVDIKIIFPLPGARRTRLEPCHGHAMRLQRHQQVMHRAGAVGHGDDQAHTVLARGLGRRQRLRQADDCEAGAVEGVVLDRVGSDVQAEFGGRPFAGNARPGGVGGGEPRTLGVAGDRTPLHVGKVGVEPALALRQRLGMRQHHLDAIQRRRKAQQVVAHQQAGFAHDVQRRLQEQVERAGNHAFRGVLHGHHTKLSRTGRRGAKHLVDADTGHPLDAGAEELQGGLFAERAGRAQERDALGRLQGAAGRHDFAPDHGHTGVLQWARVGALQSMDHLRLAVRSEDRRAFDSFDVADLVGQCRAVVEQGQQVAVDGIDLDAEFRECLGHVGSVRVGWGQRRFGLDFRMRGGWPGLRPTGRAWA